MSDYDKGLEGIYLTLEDREVLHMAGVAYKTEKYWYAKLRGRWYYLTPGQGTADKIAYTLQEVSKEKVPPSVTLKIESQQ